MTKRNPNLAAFKRGYLFPEINARKQKYLAANPGVSLISLGVGDTTEPVPPYIAHALTQGAARLGTKEGYTGYGAEQGLTALREKIAAKIYSGMVNPEEIFISDGAKCDLGRLQMLFGNHVSIAVPDPTYPVYVDGSLIQGVSQIVPMPCTPENHFFPALENLPRTDLIYFCSPNNPTGAVATKDQLTRLVALAKKNQSIIIFDAAYSLYIHDASYPKSIYEIEGANEVAIEVNSFSKIAGFTGVRLGWTVVPESLKYDDGLPVKADWSRISCTIFNGASNIAQWGGCGVLDDQGMLEIKSLIAFYMENTHILKKALATHGYEVYGGDNCPYLWVRFKGKSSWDIFQQFLEKLNLVTTPGSGFGQCGEGFIRMSAYGHRDNILSAANKLANKIS